jgi:hypothetical protein
MWLKLAPYIVGLLLVTGAVGSYVYKSKQLDKVRAENAELVLEREVLRESLRINGKVSASYVEELERLRSIPPVRPARIVRLCPEPIPVPVPGSTNGVDGPGTTRGEFPQGTGQDIGPRLYYEAGRADALAAQLRALQSWVGQHTE